MKQQKPYSLKDFEKETDIKERLRMCLIQNEFFHHLKDHELAYFNKLYQTFGMVYDAKNLMVEPGQIVQNGMDVLGRKTADKYIGDMRDVFEFGEGNGDKIVQRNAIAQFHFTLAKKARDIAQNPQELDYASRIAERATRLLNLDKVKEETTHSRRALPKRIILSSDVTLLHKQNNVDIDKEGEDE